jgi:hypothetical protein
MTNRTTKRDYERTKKAGFEVLTFKLDDNGEWKRSFYYSNVGIIRAVKELMLFQSRFGLKGRAFITRRYDSFYAESKEEREKGEEQDKLRPNVWADELDTLENWADYIQKYSIDLSEEMGVE